MLYAPFGTAQGLLTTPLSQGASLGSGDSSVICLQYAANTSVTSYSHTIHYPKVDDYSSFDIDANGTLSTSGQVRAIVGNLRSPWIPIVSGDLQISMFTVIIKLDGGKLDEVSLDQCVSTRLCALVERASPAVGLWGLHPIYYNGDRLQIRKRCW